MLKNRMIWESARDTLKRFFALAVEEKIGVGDRAG